MPEDKLRNECMHKNYSGGEEIEMIGCLRQRPTRVPSRTAGITVYVITRTRG